MHKHDLGKIRVEFVGKYHCHRRIDALPHLHLRHDQHGFARRINADEGIGSELALRMVSRLLRLVHRRRAQRQLKGEDKASGEAAFEQAAA